MSSESQVSRVQISRNELTVLSFQLSGLCEGLKLAAAAKVETSQITNKLIQKLIGEVVALVHGRATTNLPTMDGTEKNGDLMVIAGILRATLAAYMEPEDLEMQSRVFGFDGPHRQ